RSKSRKRLSAPALPAIVTDSWGMRANKRYVGGVEFVPSLLASIEADHGLRECLGAQRDVGEVGPLLRAVASTSAAGHEEHADGRDLGQLIGVVTSEAG